MEKYISKFNILSDVTKGNTNNLIICPNCSAYNLIQSKYKLTYQKIKSIKCFKCNTNIQIGDIFNFTSGSKLENTNKQYSRNIHDDYIWNGNYDII